MLNVAALQKGVRVVAETSQELASVLKARRYEIGIIAGERRPLYAQGKLSEIADGIWSKTIVGAVCNLNAVGVQLNSTWAQLPPDWRCPCCKRIKEETLIKSDDGVLIAQAVEHHDHFISYVNHAFHRELGKNWSRDFSGAAEVQRRLSSCVVGFDKSVICESCNFADGQAKMMLRCRAKIAVGFSEYFSFAPDEIRCFIRPIRNARHKLDENAILSLFEERRKREVMDFRKKAVDIEVKLLKDGFHWRSPEPSFPNAFEVQETYIDAMLEFGMEEGGNFSLCALSATDQGLKVDPDAWITAASKKDVLVNDREVKNFLESDVTAKEVGLGWCCPCCKRSVEATLRCNNKRKITFQPRTVQSNKGESVIVCLDCHSSMLKISGSARAERDDVNFDDVRRVFAFRRNRRHYVRSSDIARAAVEQVRCRAAVAREIENAELKIRQADAGKEASMMQRPARQVIKRSGLNGIY